MIRVTLDVQGIPKIQMKLEAVAEAAEGLSPFAQHTVARAAVRAIRERTAKGLDQHEKSFTAYQSESHKAARRRKGLPELVNLRFGGKMLGDLRAVRRGRGDKHPAVRFHGAKTGYIAGVHQEGRGGMPVRQFLGFERGTKSYAQVKMTAVEALRRQIRNAERRR
jgi:hypothetical protein